MSRAPNLLVVIVDDMGVHQLGCHGSAYYETPHLDRLAGEGVRFASAYSASPVCSPARAALYTSLHPARLHLTNFIPGTEPSNPRLLTPRWRAFLPVEVDTLGDLFQRQGYATAHFGKWHLAPDYHYRPGRPMDPESQGFDVVRVTRKPLTDADPEADPHHIDRITDDAIAFMRAPRDRPFLCVVAHTALHRPEMAPAAEIARFAAKPGADRDCNRPVVGAMVARVDRGVGRLLDELRQSGRDQDTVVVVTSDHGAFGRSDERKPLRGAKADLYEGGIRVPLLLRIPRNRSGPRVISAPVFGTDLLPTLLELAGLPPPRASDGCSLVPLLRDPSAPTPHAALFWHFPHYHHLGRAPCGAIRAGRWKLIEWFEETVGGAGVSEPVELFDLETDADESVNLARQEPERAASLLEQLRAWRKAVGAQDMVPNPAFDPARGGQRAAPPPGDPVNPYSL
ncbi:MAG: sulfatase [Opitutaceae bacterium]|nr:sulfatase [Opitutaceae bacterium]